MKKSDFKKLVKEIVKCIMEMDMESDSISEMSTTGGISGYSTPFAFTKNKDGSQRAISASKSIGYVPSKNKK